MKHLWLVLSLFTMLGLLTGCGPVYKTDYEFVAPKSQSGKNCHARCVQSQSSCNLQCQSQNETCRSRAKQDALYAYEQYKHQRRSEGLPVEKDISAFNHESSCNSSCGCDSLYNNCFKACGGQIIEHKKCVAFCDKAPKETL